MALLADTPVKHIIRPYILLVKNKRPYILLLKMKETLGLIRRDLVTIEMHSFFGVVINYEFNSPSSF